MDKSIIIGKEGAQKFPIKNAGVSRHHARISIVGGKWLLEDLNSTNGTFVRKADGSFLRVATIYINEDSVIRLGDESANGYSFMAHHAFEPDPENYAYEFNILRNMRNSFKKQREQMANRQRYKGLIQILLSMMLIGITFIPGIKNNIQMMILRVGMLVPPLWNFFSSGKNKMQKVYERQQHILICPRCGRPLSDFEIDKQQCMVCKAHS